MLVTHVHSNTNERSPVPEVIKMARDSNAISIIDICQSAGVVPIDLSLWNPDFAIGSCLKWLCGGPGAGYLWVNDNMLDRCRPVDVGWFSHESPFEFDIHNFRYAQDALRFWGGTPTIAPFVLATNSINLILSLGVQEIQRHNRRLTELLISQVARACHLICPREPDRRGGSVVLDFGAQQTAVADRLAQRGIVCDGRADGMRLSPHIYNSHEQIQTVVAALLDQT
ncbi:MAG: aminotransferase class V-fold PLP-dependent enzyme [Pseudomonadota bacterium]